jgi:hypothetical protein
MKKLGIVGSLFLMLVACHNQTNTAGKDGIVDANAPYMYFKEEAFDAGTVTEGQKVTHTFVVENRGGKDLQIINVETTCGCTVPTYDRKPIPSGKSAQIVVVFNSEGKSGQQNKGITVTSNAVPDTKILKLKCVVIESNNKSKKE